MGIKNMHTFLRKMCPHLYHEIHLSEYAFQKIAIDTAIYLCKFKTSYGSSWLLGFVQLCMVMRLYAIHPVFIFDHIFPPEKDDEKKRRADLRKQQKQRIGELHSEWESYKKKKTDVFFYCYLNDPELPLILYSFLFKTFISTKTGSDDTTNHRVLVEDIDREFYRMENTLLVIDPKDYDLIRDLLNVLKIKWVMAVGEAEATASYMCQMGIVDAVLTDDTDVLAYMCPVFLHRINLQDHTCTRLLVKDVYESLKLDMKGFVDFCIMCGTDYNTNIPRIGNEKAYRLIRQYGSLDDMKHLLHDSIPHYERVRELFHTRPDLPDEFKTVFFSDFPVWEEIVSFLFVNNCTQGVDMDQLYQAFCSSYNIRFDHDLTTSLSNPSETRQEKKQALFPKKSLLLNRRHTSDMSSYKKKN